MVSNFFDRSKERKLFAFLIVLPYAEVLFSMVIGSSYTLTIIVTQKSA